jgi:hypothetical protein
MSNRSSRGAQVLLLLSVLAAAAILVGCKQGKDEWVAPATDSTAPVTVADPPGGTYGDPLAVNLISNESATIYYTTDGSTPTTDNYTGQGDSPVTGISISADTLLKFFAVDGTGNEESVKTQNYVISGEPDTTPPTTTASPAGATYDHAVSVTLTPDEPATVYYTTDGSTPDTGSTVYSAPVDIALDTTLKFFAVDGAGNTESIKTENYIIDLNADTTPPMTSASPDGGTYSSGVSVTLTANEPATIYYTTDGSEPTTGSYTGTGDSPLSGISISTNTTLKFFGVDAASNEESVKTETYVFGGGSGEPVITGISPDSGPYGTEVTIQGQNFGSFGTVVFFDGIEAKTTSWSNTSITCIVPAYSEPGEVTVTTAGGESNGMYFNVDNGSHGTGGNMGSTTRQYWGYKWKKYGSYDYYIGVHEYFENNPGEAAPLMCFANTHQNEGEMLFGAVVGETYLSQPYQDRYPPDYDYPGIILYWSTETECDTNQFSEICELVGQVKGLYNIDTSRIFMHATCNKSGFFIGWVTYRPDIFWGYSTDSTYGPGSPFGDLDSRGDSPETWPAENKRMPFIFEIGASYAGGPAWAGRLKANGWIAWNGTYEMTGYDYKKTWIRWVNQDPYQEGDTYSFPSAKDGVEPAQHPGVWEWHYRHRNPSPGKLTRP